MLQFVTHKSDKFTIAEEAQMVIEGGCMWIQLSNSLPDGVTLKDALEELRPLCEENDCFLIVESDIDLAKDMRVHGVHLSKNDISPALAREELGPHAVIGVDVDSAEDILDLKGKDIDYAVLEYNNESSVDKITQIVRKIQADGFEIHIVVRGDIEISVMQELQKIGVNGFALSKQIIDSIDPVKETTIILDALNKN